MDKFDYKANKIGIILIKYVWNYFYLIFLLFVAIDIMWNSYYHSFKLPTMWDTSYSDLEYAVRFVFNCITLIMLFGLNYLIKGANESLIKNVEKYELEKAFENSKNE